MKYKINKMVSAKGKVYLEGREYKIKDFPDPFPNGWLESGYVEKVKKKKSKDE